MNFDFQDNGKSVSVEYGSIKTALPKNNYVTKATGTNSDKIFVIRSINSEWRLKIDLNVDTITGVGAGSTTATQLKNALDAIFFLDDSGSSSQDGFIDYNDTTGAFSITADTWTDLPNDGAGAFTNKNYPPSGVTELMDVSTGYIDPTELNLGDTILIRNDYTINPNTNNALLKFRYELGNGGGTYTLEKIIGRLDSGSGQDYRFSLAPDLIYMGDTNTRDNPIKIQVYCSSNATVTNAGSVIQVIKR